MKKYGAFAALFTVACSFWGCDFGKSDKGNLSEYASGASSSDGGSRSDNNDDMTSSGSGGQMEVAARKLGERGSSCNSASDCTDDLSCIVTTDCPVGVSCANKSCQPSNFDIMGTGKQCHISECKTKTDCCGDLPLKAPDKCLARDNICNSSALQDCVQSTCTSDDTCGAGTCRGYCNLDTTTRCTTADDCEPNTCIIDPQSSSNNRCSLTGYYGCSIDADCSTNSCSTSLYCDCTNLLYDPLNPICADESCTDVCGFTCEDEMCVPDTSCELDSDCDALSPLCENGLCVDCRVDDDCDDEKCVEGHCGPECEQDAQCAIFEICDSGECSYVGCQSDRECVLSGAGTASGQDPRLSICDIKKGVGSCVFPCDIDAQCSPTEVCLNGKCEYIGCETDTECKTISGLHNQPVPTPERPWTAKATCESEPSSP